MWKYIAKKVLIWILLLFVALFIPFVIINLSPGDPATFPLGGGGSTPNAIHEWREYHGLNQPILERYISYISGLFRGELAPTMPRRLGGFNPNITPTVLQNLPYTLSLITISLSTALILALPTGAIAATKKGTRIDKLIKSVALVGTSAPVFMLGMFALVLLRPLAVSGLSQQLLSGFIVGFGMFCAMVLSVRASCLEVIGQGYIATARARGLLERKVVFKHVLRNALVPSLSVFRDNLGAFFGGVVIVEFLFNRAGIGRLLIQGILSRDHALTLACVVMFVFCYVVIHIVVDIVQGAIDPLVRTKYARKSRLTA